MVVKPFLNERDMASVLFVNMEDPLKIREVINEEDMEEEYGGKLDNRGQFYGKYWPPRPSTRGVPAEMKFIIPFQSLLHHARIEFFQQQQDNEDAAF